MTESKPWSQSRTIILNGAVSLLSLVTLVATLLAGPEMAALGVSPEIGRYASIALLIFGVVNTWLRTQTAQPIAGTRGEAAATRETIERERLVQ